MKKKILPVGKPRSGKSTLLASLIELFSKKTGFLTKEILENDQRVGFSIQTSAHQKVVLAHISYPEPKVKTYGIDICALERLMQPIADFPTDHLLYIDEIGAMQLSSDRFRELCQRYLESPNLFVGTLSAWYEDDFVKAIKAKDTIWIIEVTPENREEVKKKLEKYLESFLKNK